MQAQYEDILLNRELARLDTMDKMQELRRTLQAQHNLLRLFLDFFETTTYFKEAIGISQEKEDEIIEYVSVLVNSFDVSAIIECGIFWKIVPEFCRDIFYTKIVDRSKRYTINAKIRYELESDLDKLEALIIMLEQPVGNLYEKGISHAEITHVHNRINELLNLSPIETALTRYSDFLGDEEISEFMKGIRYY